MDLTAISTLTNKITILEDGKYTHFHIMFYYNF